MRAIPGAPTLLALDASTYRGTVAVLHDGALRASREVAMKGADAERLMPAVAEALAEAAVAPDTLTAIVCGGGPGSFTSLRIAGAIAKGLASASGAPVLAMPSLALVALAGGGHGRVLATMDAMRGDRYAALVTVAAPSAGDASRPGGEVVTGYEFLGVWPGAAIEALAARHRAARLVDAGETPSLAAGVRAFGLALPDGRRIGAPEALVLGPVSLAAWEPDYGRQAEAQVQWEARHGRALPADPAIAVASAVTATP